MIGRTARLADEVIVAVGMNMAKNGLFRPDERVAMLREACQGWTNVSVMTFDGLLVDFCRAHDAEVISKGVRAADFAYELQMAQMNRRLTGVDTVFLPTAPEWAFVSSSLVREIATLGGDVTPFLPPARGRADRRPGGREASGQHRVDGRICERLTLQRTGYVPIGG